MYSGLQVFGEDRERAVPGAGKWGNKKKPSQLHAGPQPEIQQEEQERGGGQEKRR